MVRRGATFFFTLPGEKYNDQKLDLYYLLMTFCNLARSLAWSPVTGASADCSLFIPLHDQRSNHVRRRTTARLRWNAGPLESFAMGNIGTELNGEETVVHRVEAFVYENERAS